MKTKTLRFTLLLSLVCLVSIPSFSTYAQKIHVEKKNGKYTRKYVNGNTRIKMISEGDIELSMDDKSITSISPGGYIDYEKNKEQLVIKSSRNGKLSYRYFVRGKEQSFQPNGQKLLDEIIKDLVNQGIGAEARVKRLYKEGGTDKVVKALDGLSSDYIKAKYIKYLSEQDGITNQDISKAILSLSTQLSSDYEKSKLLRGLNTKALRYDKTSDAYLKVVASMSSDYEKSKSLRHFFEGVISEDMINAGIETSKNISSDYEFAKMLRSLLNDKPLNTATLSKVIEATPNINSDYERTRVYKELVQQKNLSQPQLKQILTDSQKIPSDHERSKLLIYILGNTELDTQNFALLLDNSDAINSDYEKRKVYSYALENTKTNTAQLKNILEKVPGINADHEKSRILVQIAARMERNDDTLRKVFLQSAKTINSDHEYGRVMRAIGE